VIYSDRGRDAHAERPQAETFAASGSAWRASSGLTILTISSRSPLVIWSCTGRQRILSRNGVASWRNSAFELWMGHRAEPKGLDAPATPARSSGFPGQPPRWGEKAGRHGLVSDRKSFDSRGFRRAPGPKHYNCVSVVPRSARASALAATRRDSADHCPRRKAASFRLKIRDGSGRPVLFIGAARAQTTINSGDAWTEQGARCRFRITEKRLQREFARRRWPERFLRHLSKQLGIHLQRAAIRYRQGLMQTEDRNRSEIAEVTPGMFREERMSAISMTTQAPALGNRRLCVRSRVARIQNNE